MGLTDLTVRLMLIFFPGIVCFFIFDSFTAHRERKAHEILLLSYIYGILSYSIFAIISWPIRGVSLLWQRSGHPRAWELSVFNWLSDSNAKLDFWEIIAATVIAFALAFVLSLCHRKKLLHAIGQRLKVSSKFAELDVWNFAFNMDDARWCVVRDMGNHIMFQGYIRAFSDVGEAAEVLLTQVSVYDERTGELCYQADRIYLARKKDDLTIQFQDLPQREEASNVRQDDKDVAACGDSDSTAAGRNGSERKPESTQHQHVSPTQADGELSPEQQR
jgi:hypothetical protein